MDAMRPGWTPARAMDVMAGLPSASPDPSYSATPQARMSPGEPADVPSKQATSVSFLVTIDLRRRVAIITPSVHVPNLVHLSIIRVSARFQ